jgi:hypothetical protein
MKTKKIINILFLILFLTLLFYHYCILEYNKAIYDLSLVIIISLLSIGNNTNKKNN